MKKFCVNYCYNYNFCYSFVNDEVYLNYCKNMLLGWFKYAFPEEENVNYRILPFSIKFANTHNELEKYKAAYNREKTDYLNQILVFHSPFDINPNIKKALKTSCLLDEIGYKLYFLSINPKLPWKDYFEDYLHYFGIHDLSFFKNKKIRSEKYDPELLQFAADLRLCNPPIKYKKIEKLVGIPKSTIIGYMERNHLEQDYNVTGVDEISSEDLDRYHELAASGYVTPNIF